VSVRERVGALRDQLAARRYGELAGEFVRYRSDPTDDAVAGVVRSVCAEGGQGAAAFRDGLGGGDAETLRLFAMRRTLLARRQASIGPAYEALDACSLLATPDDVPWDSWLRGALFVARSLGGDLDSIARRYRDLADPDAVARFDVANESLRRVDTIAQCRLAEVRTTCGVGFVETLVFEGRPTIGFLGAPRQGDHRLDYQPATNLAQLAVNLANALEDAPGVAVGPISQDQLAATMFQLTTSGSFLPVSGCLSFVARDLVREASFTVFAAELAEGTSVDELAAAARGAGAQVSAGDSPRLVVLSPQPSFDEGDEGVAELGDYEDLVRGALADPATR
jgi:hypothetical protein